MDTSSISQANSPDRLAFVYGLTDPRLGIIRYVGQSFNPRSRLSKHISAARSGEEDTYKSRWIRILLAENMRPAIIMLETVTAATRGEREVFWIQKLRSEGSPLTNVCEGGILNPGGYKFTAEQCAKISKRMRGKIVSAETRERMSKARIGMKASESVRRAMSESRKGRKMPAEAIKKTAAAHTGRKRSLATVLKQKVAWARHSPSKHRGASRDGKRWKARANFQNKRYYLGMFDTAEEAAAAVRTKEEGLLAEFGRRLRAGELK